MLNLLGDLWFRDGGAAASEPAWAEVLALPGAHLHLYGKLEARRGRKMGHLTVTAATPSRRRGARAARGRAAGHRRRRSAEGRCDRSTATMPPLDQAAQRLAAGGLVAFPTETVYGLGARADNDAAVAGSSRQGPASRPPADRPRRRRAPAPSASRRAAAVARA